MEASSRFYRRLVDNSSLLILPCGICTSVAVDQESKLEIITSASNEDFTGDTVTSSYVAYAGNHLTEATLMKEVLKVDG
jgi:hypothetical protein